jgi:ketosteroid isomerase-like protein
MKTASIAFTLLASASASASAFGFAPAASASGPEARNKALVAAAFEAWSAGTGSPFALLSEEATWTIAGNSAAAGTYRDRETFLREVIRPFNARMSQGLRPVVRSLVAEGNSVVIRFDAAGIARDGAAYRNSYAWFFEMRGGQVIGATAFFDSIAFDELWRRVPPGPDPAATTR